MNEYKYFVGKFAFQTPTQIEDMKKEEEAIAYIKANTDISNVKNAYSLYKNLNEKPSFHTQVGIMFMQELFDLIVESGLIQEKNMEPIKIEAANPFRITPKLDPSEEKLRNTKAEQKLLKVQRKHKNLWIVNFGLIAIIAAMFYIARNSDYSMISDYETRLVDKYATWEEDLTQREEAIRAQESAGQK